MRQKAHASVITPQKRPHTLLPSETQQANAYKQTAVFSYWANLQGCSKFLYTSKILTGILLKKEKKKVVAVSVLAVTQ